MDQILTQELGLFLGRWVGSTCTQRIGMLQQPSTSYHRLGDSCVGDAGTVQPRGAGDCCV